MKVGDMVDCPRCHGSGLTPNRKGPCPNCGGLGQVPQRAVISGSVVAAQ